MSKVRDIVDGRTLSWVDENETVAQVARKMVDLQMGAILVLHSGELRGVFSERDLMQRVVVECLDPETTPVSAVMTKEVVTIDECDAVEQAMEAMRNHNCRHLPVLREGRVTAFLSMRDLMHHELASRTDEVQHMRAYIQTST
jgi:signal-transduction protein with cAMP-binding, CBS, and nucleotidyltransferase domain